RALVAALLNRKEYDPPGVAELLVAHEEATSFAHDLADLSTPRSAQQLLSREQHEVRFGKLMARSSARSNNLMLACSMPHASGWLLAPPIAGLGLTLLSVQFRTAIKFRLGFPLFSEEPFPCPALSRRQGMWLGSMPSAVTMAPRFCFATRPTQLGLLGSRR